MNSKPKATIPGRLSGKGVIPYVIRDPQSLMWTGDTGSGSGMTALIA
ncbi:hypothetical protein [Rhodohalobacter sp. 8-1]